MKQFWLQVTALLIVIFAGLWVSVNPTVLKSLLSSNPSIPATPVGSNSKKMIMIVSTSGQTKVTISVELSDTAQKRALGLGGRSSLDPNSGMLFLFDQPSVPQFWMKGMKFPLDIIWINGDNVVGVAESVLPPAGTPGEILPIYSPSSAVDKVLEVNAGFARQHNIGPGDKLKQVQ